MGILIKDLYENFELSVRGYNVCDKVKLISIDDARKHLLKYGNFLNIQNCGARTNKEIIACIERFSEVENLSPKKVEVNNASPINHNLSDKVINALVVAELDKLSVRARNGLIHFFGNKVPTKEQIQQYFIDKKFDARKIKNIGRKSTVEIESFIQAVIEIFDKSAYLPITEKTKAFTTFFDLIGFKVESEFWLKKHEQKKIPIIVFAAQYISEIFELREVDTFIFKNEYKLLERHYSLDEIGAKYEVSRERIRQRRNKITPQLLSKATKLIPLLEFSDYLNVIPKEKIVCLSTDISNENLLSEIRQTSDVFSNLILSALTNEKSYSVNALDKLDTPAVIQNYERYNCFKIFDKTYLIENYVINKGALLKICSSILNALAQRQVKDLMLDIRKICNDEVSDDAAKVIEKIVKNQFQIQIQGFVIPIRRNSVKPVHEYIHETLLRIGKPLHLSEIREQILLEKPDFESSEESMRAAINNQKKIFIHFGRASTYGLKSWEKKNGFIKGGTIRNIVIEFLKKQNTVCHISTITEHVKKYRKTDERSVLTNLKYTKKEIFCFERGGYVGLLNKKREAKNSIRQDKKITLDDLLKNIFQNKTSSKALI